MGKGERKTGVKSEDSNLTDDTLDSLSTTAKIITKSLNMKSSIRRKSKVVDKNEDENGNEDVENIARDIEEKCKILRSQLGRDFPGKSGHGQGQGQGQLQVKIDQLEETVNEKSDEISQLESRIKNMTEKQEMILNLLMGTEDELSMPSKSASKSKLKFAHLVKGDATKAFSASPQQTIISTGIFRERDEFGDKDLRCLKIKTSRRVFLHGLGFSGPLDQDNEFKVSAVIRANNDKLEVGKWTKLLKVKKGEKILLQFGKPIKLKAGKSYEIEYALKGPRLENELSEKVPLTKTQRNARGRARARGTPVHATEARFNFAAYDKEKYTISTSGVTFQIRTFKEEKGALCLLSYSIDFTTPQKNKQKQKKSKDDQDEDEDEEGEKNNDEDDDDNVVNGEEQEKNVFVTSESYSESSSDESSSSDDAQDDDEKQNPQDQQDD